MNKSVLFENSRIITGKGSYRTDEIEWNRHPVFAGVWMKNLITGSDTGGRMSCHLVKIEPGCMIGEHIHEGRMELHEVTGGAGLCTIGEETFDYSEGIVSYIPENINHTVKAGGEGLFILAKFSPALI